MRAPSPLYEGRSTSRSWRWASATSPDSFIARRVDLFDTGPCVPQLRAQCLDTLINLVGVVAPHNSLEGLVVLVAGHYPSPPRPPRGLLRVTESHDCVDVPVTESRVADPEFGSRREAAYPHLALVQVAMDVKSSLRG